jgi:general L-amino acid transport system permease protein
MVAPSDSQTAPSGASIGNIWTDERARGVILQIVAVLSVAAFIAIIVSNTLANLEKAGLAVGFGFLGDPASFEINQKLIDYSSRSTYGRALMVGLLNTVLVASLGIIAATILGFFAGVMRLSPNWLLSRIVATYVEITRNIPLLLQIILWWTILIELPRVADSLSIGSALFLNNRGVRMPAPILESGFGFVVAAFAAAVVATVVIRRWANRRHDATGQTFPTVWVGLGLIIVVPLIIHFALGQPLSWDVPVKERFNFAGGFNVVPELVALWFALTTYTGSFISEIVRSGILAISKGQTEAASALGLRPTQTMRMVIIPQALRVIIPPLTSQYLNLTKNSSLAIAIGYQDLVAVGGIILNQSGQALEIVGIWMLIYLTLSLLTSSFMNWYNKHIALIER